MGRTLILVGSSTEHGLGKEEDITSGQTTHRHASPSMRKRDVCWVINMNIYA